MRAFRIGAVAVVSLLGDVAAQKTYLFENLLKRLVDPSWLIRAPKEGERCVQWSSWDRAASRGPEDVAAWYANNDRGNYLRVVEGAAGKEHVLVDATGPGCIARIWSANPSGTLHFDIDGTRVWSVDFAALCSGKLAGVPEPLAGMRSRGGNCYLPIPFQKSMVVSATAADLYYAVDIQLLSPTDTARSFAPHLLDATAATAAVLEGGFLAQEHLADTWRSANGGTCAAGAADSRITVPERTTVTELSLAVSPVMDGRRRADLLRRILLVVRAGSEETVRVPVADFFAVGTDFAPRRGYLLGIRDDRTAYSHFPIPFPAGGEIRLEAEGDLGGAEVTLWAHTEAFSLFTQDPLLFRASYHQQKAMPTRPFRDHVVLDAKGQGRFVGCSLRVRNPSKIWWGEGDEKFTVDGEAFPSWFGTGTEDYFGYAWCDPTPFAAPFHAQVECQGPMNFGFTQLHRTHLLDSVPFQRSFRFDLEVWHWVESASIDYATVAYWYGAPGASSGLPPVPSLAERDLPRLELPPRFVAEGALEGEALRVVSCTAGRHEVQDLGIFERTFSQDAHRWWRDGKVGDALVLAVPIAAAGRYRVSAGFVMADDFAIVQCSLAGKPLGAPFDGFAERIGSSGAVELGVAELPAGDVELRLQIVGRKGKAKASHMVGLDYLRLEAVR